MTHSYISICEIHLVVLGIQHRQQTIFMLISFTTLGRRDGGVISSQTFESCSLQKFFCLHILHKNQVIYYDIVKFMLDFKRIIKTWLQKKVIRQHLWCQESLCTSHIKNSETIIHTSKLALFCFHLFFQAFIVQRLNDFPALH